MRTARAQMMVPDLSGIIAGRNGRKLELVLRMDLSTSLCLANEGSNYLLESMSSKLYVVACR